MYLQLRPCVWQVMENAELCLDDRFPGALISKLSDKHYLR